MTQYERDASDMYKHNYMVVEKTMSNREKGKMWIH